MARILLIMLMLWPGMVLAASEVFTTRAPESPNDQRYEYDQAVLELALHKTEADYGAYRLVLSPPMTFPRAVWMAQTNKFQNFFFKHTYETRLDGRGLTYVSFPIDLGIVGFRVCFVSKKAKARVEAAQSLEDIKTFSIGQGIGWSDVPILRSNAFEVVEVASYESLFMMVARNRIDLFCRGANELLSEYEAHKHIEDFDYDTSMALVHPLPRFFYTYEGNKKAFERVKIGLERAHKDGSLKKLWLKHYGESLEFINPEKRRVYWLDNPYLEGVADGYQDFFIKIVKPPR